MRYGNVLVGLLIAISSAAAARGTEPTPSAPAVRRQAAAMQEFPARRRFGVFTGGRNYWRSRGTPADNSTIPTPINRHPKGRPYSPFPDFPKNM